MKSIELKVEDTFYEHLLALIEQLPNEKVQICQIDQATEEQGVALEDAIEHVLEKNSELYEKLS